MISSLLRMILCSFFLLACIELLPAQIFEGIIYYKMDVNYKGGNLRHKQYYEEEKFGDTVAVYVNQEGYVKREFVGSSIQFGTDAYIYDPTRNIQFALYNSIDTIYWYYSDTNIVEDFEVVESVALLT